MLAEVGQGSWQPTNDSRPWVRFALKAQLIQAKTIQKRVKESSRLWEAIDEERQAADLHERHAGLVPLIRGKVARKGRATAYVCERGVCLLPTTEVRSERAT